MLRRPGAADCDRARALLAHEGAAAGDPTACGAAAQRVYDKLRAVFDPMLGVAGVEALVARSAKLSRKEHGVFAEGANVASGEQLNACIRALDAAAASEAPVALFGAFFALVATFIGQPLTTQALRSAWPMVAAPAPTEPNQ